MDFWYQDVQQTGGDGISCRAGGCGSKIDEGNISTPRVAESSYFYLFTSLAYLVGVLHFFSSLRISHA
jgi:hypothetical protein